MPFWSPFPFRAAHSHGTSSTLVVVGGATDAHSVSPTVIGFFLPPKGSILLPPLFFVSIADVFCRLSVRPPPPPDAALVAKSPACSSLSKTSSQASSESSPPDWVATARAVSIAFV